MLISANVKFRYVLRSAWGSLLFFNGLALVVSWLDAHEAQPLPLGPATMGPLAAALSIFLAFRNSSAYDRWWEGRKLWGSLINQSRTFARQVTTFMVPATAPNDMALVTRRLVERQILYAHALRANLRADPASLEGPLAAFVRSDAERARIRTAKSCATVVLQIQGEELSRALAGGHVSPLHHVELERTLAAVTDVQGGCERIKNTPMPRQYDFFPRVFVTVYALFMPFAFVESLGYYTIVVTTPVTFLFFVLAKVGALIEAPFEARHTDVPLDALCRTIEISLREQLGDTDLPPPLLPDDDVLM